MQQIGVRELKNQATEIIRDVREQHAEYVVTYRGRPVAMIMPLDNTWQQTLAPAKRPKPTADELADEMEQLRQEITEAWCTNLTAAEAVAEQRR